MRTRSAGPMPPGPDEEQLRPQVTEELLQDIAQRIVEAFHPDKIILFGSYAYGTPHKDSDIDLLVIMEAEGTRIERIRNVSRIAKVYFLPMDILVYSPAEIESRLAMGDFFIAEILAKGRVLYSHGAAR